MGDKINPDALRPDQTHDLLDLVEQFLGRFVEQKVRLVEEKNELRLRRVADLRQLFEQFGQEPKQEGGVEPRA